MIRRASLALLALALLPSCKSPDASKALGDETPPGGLEPGDDAADFQPFMPLDDMIARAKTRAYWPDQQTDWKTAADAERNALMATPACQDFVKFLLPPADQDQLTAQQQGVSVDKLKDADVSLKTDGVMVIKNGVVWFEDYTGPYKQDPSKLHCMWSASKSFTAGVLGAVAQASERKAAGEDLPFGRLTKDGKPIRLDTRMKELFDASQLNGDPKFGELTVETILAMGPNLEWSERYEDDIEASSIAKMLWIKGYKDMAKFAASVPFGPEGPSNKFIYSSGNALMLFRALRDVYGEQYDRMPWDVLFDRVGMKRVAFERDQLGTFVGSSYVHTTLRDMAKFGYAYLNGGWYKDQQVIHPDFVQKARELSAGMKADGTGDKEIEHEEAFYGLGFWINPNPRQLQQAGVKSFGPGFRKAKFFEKAPADTFFAAGHYGQNILIFPKDDLMIVRFSHDKEYWTKLDRMMSKARACFAAQGGAQ